MDWTEFDIILVRPSRGEISAEVDACWHLWEKVWSQTFRDLDGNGQVYSDNFSRQDEILCLRYKGSPIALVAHRYGDAKTEYLFRDSYFGCWSELAKRQLSYHGTKIAVGSHITIDVDFRKSAKSEFSAKKIIAYASLKHLRAQDVDAITGVMRADKGMHTLFYDAGAVPLQKNLIFHNVPVDVVAFFPKQIAVVIPEEYLKILEIIEKQKPGGSMYDHKKTA